MMNRKQKHIFIHLLFTLIVVSMLTAIPFEVFAASRQKSSLLNYTVDTVISGDGKLFWDYGENASFFLSDGIETYADDCRVKSAEVYCFNKLFRRGLIPQPAANSYFAGFYGADGKKINISKTNIDLIRVSVDGIYYYDCYDAYDNSKFKKYSKSAYKSRVKAYLKGIYGTSRYKVMGTVPLYRIPKKNAYYEARFEPKVAPSVKIKPSLVKTYGDPGFNLLSGKSSKYKYIFKSSNRKVISIDKTSGFATVQGPGIATLTCQIAETEKTVAASYETTVTVYPQEVQLLSAKQTKKKLDVSWMKQSKNSGYEIQVSNNKSFASILASKTIRSSKANTAKLQLKSEVCHNYVRIRPYKSSKGKKLYGDFTVIKISR